VALAIDHGFIRHRPLTGLGFLGLLRMNELLGGWATGQLHPRLAALVEPLRDELAA